MTPTPGPEALRISVVGLGYVGAVTGACLAELGFSVVCVDVDDNRVRRIETGEAPIHEAGLDELVHRTAGRKLHATTDLRSAVLESDVTLVAVGTPFDGSRIDLGAIRQVAAEIGAVLREKDEYHAVVIKSTVIPGTTRDVVVPLLEETSGKRAGRDFGVGMNPEFLTEGQAVEDFMRPDRLVLGAIDDRTRRTLDELYAPFPPDVPRLHTNTTTAEAIKYASNALLATSISFANEIGNICSAVGDTDVVDVMHGVHLSRYLTPLAPDGRPVQAPLAAFLEAGCGFGGSCLPKDLRALVARAGELDQEVPVLEGALQTNDGRADELLRLIALHVPNLRGVNVLVLGLAFKPGTDDVRESPAVPIIARLLEQGAAVTVHDPVVKDVPDGVARHDEVAMSASLEEGLSVADVVVLVTRWDQYDSVPRLLADLGRQPLFVDGRRMLGNSEFAHYAGIGRSA